MRFLEAQNKRLTDELDKLKSRWGKDTTQIKAMFQVELDEARRLLDDGEKEKARLEIKIASLEEINEELAVKWVCLHIICCSFDFSCTDEIGYFFETDEGDSEIESRREKRFKVQKNVTFIETLKTTPAIFLR